MFRAGDIISVTQLIKNFKAVSRYITMTPIPILITQKKDNPLVLLPVEVFEDMMAGVHLKNSDTDAPPSLKDYLSV